MNVVDTSGTCYLDGDCLFSDLSYIEGSGKPKSQGDVCCATFPRETWIEESKSYVFEKTKHCYSKIILQNKSEFNYYKQAYCDSALGGISAAFALGASVVALMAF